MFTPLALALCLFAACDSSGGPPSDAFPFNPDTLDFDQVDALTFGDYVQPLLAYRNVFGVDKADPSARLDDYAWDALFASEWSHTVIPFDAGESLLLKLRTDLGDDVAIPYPNLRDLQDDEVRYLARWIEEGAKNDQGVVAFADAEALIYVCNQMANRVAILDAERMQVIRYVYFDAFGESEGQMMGALPHHVAAEPDGSAWYVNLIAGTDGGSILKLSADLTMDPADPGYLLAREMPPEGESTFQKPGMLWLDSTSNRLFAGRSFSADPTSQGVANIDRETMAFEVVPTVNINHPHAVGVSQNGRWLLTAALDPPNAISVIDAATGDAVDQIILEDSDRLGFVQYGVSPDGSTVVLTSQTSGELFLLDLEPDSGEITLMDRIEVGMQPWHPAFSPDGSTVYVPNRGSHTVLFVDIDSRTVTQTLGNPDDGTVLFSEPHGSSLTADGRYLFIANRNTQQIPTAPVRPPSQPFENEDGEERPATDFGFVTVIDTESGEVVEVITMGKWASGMAVYDPR